MTTESRLPPLRDVRAARKQGKAAIIRRQRDRFAGLVGLACAGSPYHREHYNDLGHRPVRHARRNTRVRRGPRADREKFLDHYTVSTTSGTTGTPGIFLADQRVLAVTAAVGSRTLSS